MQISSSFNLVGIAPSFYFATSFQVSHTQSYSLALIITIVQSMLPVIVDSYINENESVVGKFEFS